MKKYLIPLALTLLVKPVLAEPLDKVVAIVNDKVITATELASQYDITKQQQLAQGAAVPSDKVLKKQVLQHLIDESLQLQLVKQNNMTVDSTELNEAIEKIAAANHVTVDKLRELVETQSGMSWKKYRATIRKEMLINRLQQKLVAKEAMVTPQQVDDFVKTAPEQINQDVVYHLENIIIPLPEEPTSEQLKAAREKAFALIAKAKQGEKFNQLMITEATNTFMLEGGDLGERHLAELPDLFAQEVVKMKVGDVRGPLRAGNGLQLIRLVEAKGAVMHHEVTKYHVRHILLKPDIGTLPAEVKKQAFNIYQQIKSGKSFAKLAKQHSLDVASGRKGGDLGWVGPGEVVPEFEKAMMSLPLHVVSKPVKSAFGWHIIEVLEHKTVDDSHSFKRQQVLQFLQQKKFVEAVQNWKQHLRGDSYIKIMDKDLA